MKKDATKKKQGPFFAKFLESSEIKEEGHKIKGGIETKKYPSDWDDR